MTTAARSSAGTDAVMASFGRAAPRYRVHAGVQRRMADWLAEWLPADRTGCALELGAGTGVFTERLVPWGGPLLATDLSPEMCAAGRRTVPQASWTVMDAASPGGAGWDWIFSSSMLQWMSDPAAVIAAWRERLSPRGRILAAMYVDETLPEMRAIGCEGPVHWRPVEDWRATLTGCGLRILRDDVVCHTLEYPSAAAFWRTLHAVGAAPSRRTAPGQLRRWLRAYDQHHRTARGVRATWTFYRFEAALR